MDLAKWLAYGSVMVALGMSGDGVGAEVGKVSSVGGSHF